MPLRLFIPGVVDVGMAAIEFTTLEGRQWNGLTNVVVRQAVRLLKFRSDIVLYQSIFTRRPETGWLQQTVDVATVDSWDVADVLSIWRSCCRALTVDVCPQMQPPLRQQPINLSFAENAT